MISLVFIVCKPAVAHGSKMAHQVHNFWRNFIFFLRLLKCLIFESDVDSFPWRSGQGLRTALRCSDFYPTRCASFQNLRHRQKIFYCGETIVEEFQCCRYVELGFFFFPYSISVRCFITYGSFYREANHIFRQPRCIETWFRLAAEYPRRRRKDRHPSHH